MAFSLFKPVAATLPSILFFVLLPPSLPQQSVNGKCKKHIFTQKFPFYKIKEQSEQETSDFERKYCIPVPMVHTVQDKAATNRWIKHLVLILQPCQAPIKGFILQLLLCFYSENI